MTTPHRTLTGLVVLFVVQTLMAGISSAPSVLGATSLKAQSQAGPEPRILILGSPHMAQTDREWDPEVVGHVVRALEAYAPDMVVVEHLPPEWPKGRGRDYRPGFDLDAFAERWDVEKPAAGSDPCARARQLFLRRDLANAAYVWLADGVDCPAEEEPAVAEWLDRWKRHELARIAFPVARASGLDGVVSFDYQGDDARWFLDPEYMEEVRTQGTPEERAEADSMWAAVTRFRKEAARDEQGSLLHILRERNSRSWMEDQRRLYEDVLPRLTYEEAGSRQTANYWLRNRRMFDRIDDAAAERDARRILVLVGAGHKYFLDEIARKRGYEWVDPLKYLGEESPAIRTGGASRLGAGAP